MPSHRFEQERGRLKMSPSPADKPGGVGVSHFTARCPGNAAQVLARTKEVLVAISESSTPWPTLAEWRTKLPPWFLDRCAPEMTRKQAEEWLAAWGALPPAERDRAEKERPWSLADWLHWMEPSNRPWAWWDGHARDANTLSLVIELGEWPFPWGSLRWLVVAAGAESVEAAE